MMSEVIQKGKAAKTSSYLLTGVTIEEKNKALRFIAEQIVADQDRILEENKRDIAKGKEQGLSAAVLDRIMLNETRIQDMAQEIHLLIDLQDPIGQVLETIEKKKVLDIHKKRVYIGVIGMMYESRPNVTSDAATLSLRTGNAVILRGSSSAKFSNMALVSSIHNALERSALPVDAVQLSAEERRVGKECRLRCSREQ